MAELDKKTQKSQTDLVQSVLEAQEKRNLERVDVLITNAIKQLKMSRFKPDLTTCLSLIYLARICPKLFNQSGSIKEVLKSSLRRDNGPANIKGKNDIVLPVLAANIMLACSDGPEIRSLILHKIEQWLAPPNQKASDMIQHLLATLCRKCHGDQATITFLVDIKQHWLQYLEENFDTYGRVPSDLCSSIRKLLMNPETTCESFITYLKFLAKHDWDVDNLSREVSKFIIERPITFCSMLKEKDFGVQLKKMIFKIFIRHLDQLTKAANEDSSAMEVEEDPVKPKVADAGFAGVIVKLEPKDPAEEKPTVIKPSPIEDQKPVKEETKPLTGDAKPKINPEASDSNNGDSETPRKSDDENSSEAKLVRLLHVTLVKCSKSVLMSRITIEAMLTLLTEEDCSEDCAEEFEELSSHWATKPSGKLSKVAMVYEDETLRVLYILPEKLIQRLVQSSNEQLVKIGLRLSDRSQMVRLLHLFGSPMPLVDSIIKTLNEVEDIEQIRSEIKDASYFGQLLEFYSSTGVKGANDLLKRLDQPTLV